MKIKAHVPTQQYGFIEISGTPEEEALILEAYNRYAEAPIKWRSGPTKRLKDFFGNEIDYDEVNHIYSWEGVQYVSGSVWAKQFEKPFDEARISEAMANKWGVDAQSIRDMWTLKRNISIGLGTSIHSALELYGKYDGLAKAMEKTTNLHDHPVVKKAVEQFYTKHPEKAEYEALIVDHKNKRAGRVDRLAILGDRKCRVEDYKTNAQITPDKLKVYFEQLKFYSGIMRANGWETEPEVIHQWDGTWTTHMEQK